MGRHPDKLIIVRHGARLDEALDDVRLQAFRSHEHGYDSPLSYKGWRQSQALGRYLARLILYPGNPDRRRKKIIIHSSPFTRCLQTSIGIASGFGEVVPPSGDEENHSTQVLTPEDEKSLHSELHTSAAGAHLETILSRSVSDLQDYESITKDIEQDYSASEVASYHKIVLRVEPWLREWISERDFGPQHDDYVKPSAMLTRAATVLTDSRAADGVRAPVIQNEQEHLIADFPRDIAQQPGHFLREQEELAARDAPDPSAPFHKADGTYNSPAPNYAILADDQIPRGYVAHARDACVLLDRAWGGVGVDRGYFPESWHSFHARIQGGLEALLRWYSIYSDFQHEGLGNALDSDNSCFAQPFAQTRLMEESRDSDKEWRRIQGREGKKQETPAHTGFELERQLSGMSFEGQTPDDDQEFIVILVTHNGGCIKLLNVLTQRPVLIDFPQACLTIAVRAEDKIREDSDEALPSDLYKVILRGSIAYLGPTVVTKTIADFIARPQGARQQINESGRSSRRPTLSRGRTDESPPGSLMWGQRSPPDGNLGDGNSAIVGVQTGLWKPGGGNLKRRPTMRE